MPVDYQQVRAKIKSMVRWAINEQQRKDLLLSEAAAILHTQSIHLNELQELVSRAKSANPHLRCAVPVTEPLDSHQVYQPLREDVIVMAADGSQINPDRNDPVEFGIVNIGAIRLAPGRGHLPVEHKESELLYGDDFYDLQGNRLGEEIVALRRDYVERQYLAKLAEREEGMVITLTDGPLELYREPRQSDAYQKYLEDYLKILQDLATKQTATAGYVDKPRSDLVVRLLELVMIGTENLSRAGQSRPFLSLSDADLFSTILPPGARSAVFAIQSPSSTHFRGDLSIHFFYLNVGTIKQANLARVEIPCWVAKSPIVLNSLQSILIDQCSQMGSQPYPYLLYRAHEIALVKYMDKEEISHLIAAEFHRQGISTGRISGKQGSKNIDTNRKRMHL